MAMPRREGAGATAAALDEIMVIGTAGIETTDAAAAIFCLSIIVTLLAEACAYCSHRANRFPFGDP
jgi:hypothetical protein